MIDRIMLAALPALLSLTIFTGAFLFFSAELMIARMILPLFGGTPAVWNTCMMFFQAVLLAGYCYAHISGTKVRVTRQFIIHLTILLAACIVLPIAVSRQWAIHADGSPIGHILIMLLISVGLPFLGISATAPLLQKWFARTGHPSAGDPYFLYSASNFGSMLALLSYPTLIEPYFKLVEQSRAWTIGYFIMLALTGISAWVTWKFMPVRVSGDKGSKKNETGVRIAGDLGLTHKERGRWVLFAFVPSSLLLGVTTILSTDVTPIPLFWIIPLSLYLLSFIIVFARIPAMVHRVMVILLPITLVALIFVIYSYIKIPEWIIFVFHLVNFFIYCMFCHGEIARTRPITEHLTEFYLWISVGGLLGGIFNSLIAPVIFNTVLEYPLILIIGALLLPAGSKKRLTGMRKWKDILIYSGAPLVLVALTYWLRAGEHMPHKNLPWSPYLLVVALCGIILLLCYGLIYLKRHFLFGIGIAAVLLTIAAAEGFKQNIVHRERSFFGILTVARSIDGRFMILYHGTTRHGIQWLNPSNPSNRIEPLAYYHWQGPVGHVFWEFGGQKKKSRIAVAGLGTGSLASYAGPGQKIDFYEIDPAVKRIATNPLYFSFLTECTADWNIIMGDARLTMEKAPPNYYGMIILDAFNSDAIPVHLLTRQAMDIYFSKLNEDGILMIHISNKYVNLAPVLARLADEKGFADRLCHDFGNEKIGKLGTTWVLLARKETDFGGLTRSNLWTKIKRQEKVNVWTDDFSNVFSVFKW